MTLHRITALAVAAILVTVLASPGVAQTRNTQMPRMNGGIRPTTITGTVWDQQTKPVKNVRVRLHKIGARQVDGALIPVDQIAATTTTNDNGEFTFQGFEGGEFVAELVDNRGNVLATSPQIRVESGQTAVTFIRLMPRGRSGALGGMWGSAALAAVAAAAGLGLTAVEPCQCGPLSPEG
jgi:hypothetical protein